MTRVKDAPNKELEQVKPELDFMAEAMGFEANSLKVMAHKPELLRGFISLSVAVLGPDSTVSVGLRQMVAHVASCSAGCSYCQAHTGHRAELLGVDTKKLSQLHVFRESNLFSESERAALSLAKAAGEVPNATSDEHFSEVRRFYSEKEIVEILSVVALFGFLNRWNDTLATTLEDSPIAFAQAHLEKTGWDAGNHSGRKIEN